MDRRVPRVAAMEWPHIARDHSLYFNDAELAFQLFAHETQALVNEENDFMLARRLQEEEAQEPAVPGPPNRRAASADAVRQRRPERLLPAQHHGTHGTFSDIMGRVAQTFMRRGGIAPVTSRQTTRPFLQRPVRKPEPRECVICRTDCPGIHVKVPCGHFYDVACLRELIQASTRDESLYPPRCCKQTIPRKLFEPHLDSQLSALFSEKSIEFGTLKRVYCVKPSCSRFLGPRSASRTSYTFVCPSCSTRTCNQCRQEVKGLKHMCGKDNDEGGKQLIKLSRKAGWAACPGCERVIELRAGCFHMTCVCKTQFCYQCRAIWKTCSCSQWDELRLTEETERRISLLPPLLAAEPQDLLHAVLQDRPPIPEARVPANEGPTTGRIPVTVNTRYLPRRGRTLVRDKPPLPSPEPGSPPTPPPKRATTDGILGTPQSQSQPQAEGSGSSTGTQVRPRPRISAPAVMQARESILARGIEAQELRTKRKLRLSRRRVESPLKPSTSATDQSAVNTVALEERIDRLLQAVEHFPCQHQWKPEDSQSVCDGCYRSGSLLFTCSLCAARACTRCQVNRI